MYKLKSVGNESEVSTKTTCLLSLVCLTRKVNNLTVCVCIYVCIKKEWEKQIDKFVVHTYIVKEVLVPNCTEQKEVKGWD